MGAYNLENRMKFISENIKRIAEHPTQSSHICEMMACDNENGTPAPSIRSHFDHTRPDGDNVEVKASANNEYSSLQNKQDYNEFIKCIDKNTGNVSTIPKERMYEQDEEGNYVHLVRGGGGLRFNGNDKRGPELLKEFRTSV